MTKPLRYLAYKFRTHRPLPIGTIVEVMPGFQSVQPWVSSMGACIGRVGIVSEYAHNLEGAYTPRVDFIAPDDYWWFPNCSLKVLRD